MRVLCSCLPGYGHLHPLVPFARALQARGHEVAFATERRFCDRAQRAGFAAFEAGIGPGKVLERTLALPGVMPPGPGDLWTFGARMFAGVAAGAKVGDLVRLVERWGADLLVHDITDFAGPIAASRAGIPYAGHGLGPLFPGEFFQAATEFVAPVWQEWDLTPPPLGGMFATAYLDPCPPSLQAPAIEGMGPVARPLRPVPFDAVEGEELPGWFDALADHGRPVVYVTLGTLDNDAPGVIEAAVEGLRHEPLEVVVTVGPDRDPEALGPQPANVHVERYIPQSLAFPACDLAVAHGGSGTLLAALAHGLPLVLLPQGANQFWNAERCAELGAGIRLAPEDVSAGSIRHAVTTLLDDPRYRERAEVLAAEIAALPAPQAVAAGIDDLRATRR